MTQAAVRQRVSHEKLGAAKYIGFLKAPTVIIHELIGEKYQLKQFSEDEAIESLMFN